MRAREANTALPLAEAQLKIPDVVEPLLAERLLEAQGEKGIVQVRIRLGAPIHHAETDDYFCLIQISGLGDDRVRFIAGLDELQALKLSLEYLAETVVFLAGKNNLRLTWHGSSDIGL